jgi:alkylation response protein AidB-like acyl-CoA dehydrogenase
MIAGTPEQKDYHLKRIAAGNVLWCQGFSELGAGTDLGAMSTTATRDGGEYVINGEKVWTSYARGAEFCFLLARTNPKARRGEGVSIFLVPTDTPGFTIKPFRSDLDIHEFNRMTLDNVRVPASTLLGEENQGWKVIKRALSHERIGGPRYQRALVVARRLARIAQERGWWLRDGVRTRYVAAEAACQAARMLVYQAIDARQKGLPDNLPVSMARVAIVRSERVVAELALELFEDESLARDSIGNAQFKTSMIAGLGGGSVEVQLNTVAGALLGPRR